MVEQFAGRRVEPMRVPEMPRGYGLRDPMVLPLNQALWLHAGLFTMYGAVMAWVLFW